MEKMFKDEPPQYEIVGEYQDAILMILNEDEKAKSILKKFNDNSIDLISKGKATEKEYQSARKTLLYMLISGNEKAMHLYSDMVYYSLREEIK